MKTTPMEQAHKELGIARAAYATALGRIDELQQECISLRQRVPGESSPDLLAAMSRCLDEQLHSGIAKRDPKISAADLEMMLTSLLRLGQG